MSGSEQVMAVLLEEDDLRLVHRDWPSKMRLAVCLMPSGDCQLLLFRQEEAGIFAPRLRKHLGLRPEEICVYPPVTGFPTRQLRYSDERSLAALLADSPQLVEDATDYSVNFAFALEEGLNPVEFLGVEEVTAAVAVAEPDIQEEGGPLMFSSRRVPEAPPVPLNVRKLTFDLAREAARYAEGETQEVAVSAKPVEAQPFPGEAFKPISEMEEPQGFRLTIEDDFFVISNGSGPVVDIENAGGLFMRDDRRLLAIRINEMGHSPPNTLRLQRDILPKSLKATLNAARGAVDVTVEAPFVYVALPAEPKEEVAPQSVKASDQKAAKATESVKQPKRRRGLRLLGLTTLTLVAIFVVLGTQPLEMLQESAEIGPIDWSQFRLSMQSDQ